jgi:hypothetical protein
MSRGSGHLIIISERARHIWQIQFTPRAIAMLVIAFLISFGIVVLVGYMYPPLISDVEHARMLAENRALRIETRNLTVKMQKLTGDVSRLEDISGRIQQHIEAH